MASRLVTRIGKHTRGGGREERERDRDEIRDRQTDRKLIEWQDPRIDFLDEL